MTTYSEMVERIEELRKFIFDSMEQDILGDMQSFMGNHGIACPLPGTNEIDDNQTIRERFKVAALREIGPMFAMARTALEREVYNYSRQYHIASIPAGGRGENNNDHVPTIRSAQDDH